MQLFLQGFVAWWWRVTWPHPLRGHMTIVRPTKRRRKRKKMKVGI